MAKSRAQLDAEIKEALLRPIPHEPLARSESLAAYAGRVSRVRKRRQKLLH
jgi:hypothetical protein